MITPRVRPPLGNTKRTCQSTFFQIQLDFVHHGEKDVTSIDIRKRNLQHDVNESLVSSVESSGALHVTDLQKIDGHRLG
jgi:hypothetical protein